MAEHLLRILKQQEDIKYAPLFAVYLIKPTSCSWHVSYDDDNFSYVGNTAVCNDDLSLQPLFRIRQDIIVNWLTSSGGEGLQHEIDRIDSELIGHKPAFLIEPTRTILYDDDYGQTLPDVLCEEIVEDLKKELDVKQWPESKPLGNVIDVTNLVRISTEGSSNLYETTESSLDDDSDENICNVPILWSRTVSSESCSLKLCIDALVTAPLDTPSNKLLYMFRDAVFRQRNALSLRMKVDKQKWLFRPVHFQSEFKSGVTITALLPYVDFNGATIADDTCTQYRRTLHDRFLLPADRPMFLHKLSCFSDQLKDTAHLVNPHEGLALPDVKEGKLALVRGKYSYHHYMQDDFNDNVWGCAYRSLQTLASWFWHQGYTDRTYPSHEEIQKALVVVGDKDSSFIGSNEWIGSLEVSFCLEYMYDVTSKTLHVSTGAEMAYKGREIYEHFVTEGTPIMIGGGVLAHTIVGVIFNEHTSEIRFLIVDPHFTGKDQLKTVQSKGWIGWKGPEFWNQTAHYNLCMPQRPRVL